MLSVKPASAVSWSIRITRLTTDMGFDRDASITQMDDGKIWVVWPRSFFGNDTIFCKISSDLGDSWSSRINLTAYADSSQKSSPSTFQIMNGSIWLVWASDKYGPPPPPPYFTLDASPESLTIPQGDSDTSTIIITSVNYFSGLVNVSASEPPGVTTTLNPDKVTLPPNGIAFSTLSVSVDATATPGNYVLSVVGKSSSHTEMIEIALEITESPASGHASHTSTSSSSNSSPTQSDYNIYCKVSHDYGASWSSEIQLTYNSSSDASPSMIQASNGTIWLVWSSGRTGNPDIFFKTSSDGGASWFNATQLTNSSNRDRSPSITQAEDGRIWVVWSSDRLGDNDIFFNIYNGSHWLGDMRLPTDTADDTNPAILQTRDKKIWIFWDRRATATATSDIWYKSSADNGDTWSASEQLEDPEDAEEDVWPSVTQSSDLTMWVVWTSNRGEQPDGNWDVYCRGSLVGDINEDGKVNIHDLTIVAVSYGTEVGEPYYNPDADINKDGIVDISDVSIIGKTYGAT